MSPGLLIIRKRMIRKPQPPSTSWERNAKKNGPGDTKQRSVRDLNKFGRNNDASRMKEVEEEDSLLTSKEPFMMITKLI